MFKVGDVVKFKFHIGRDYEYGEVISVTSEYTFLNRVQPIMVNFPNRGKGCFFEDGKYTLDEYSKLEHATPLDKALL